jgi:redox-sensitive bicupin YhaK (pirin superfamily)
MSEPKTVQAVLSASEPHWVGDGFPVHSLFSVHDARMGPMGERISPFLLLDYGTPHQFPPTDRPRGVDSHPHKGFETVTIVYQGALEHRDSTGSHGTIGPGDVQWMTAASGILHEEKHERNWSKRGGVLQMAQLWVNLPARDKSAPPGYQTLLRDQIPTVELPNGHGGGGSVRVIAGEFNGAKGAARTFTPINVYDMRLNAGHETSFNLPDDHNTAIVVLDGEVTINSSHPAQGVSLALFDTNGEEITIAAATHATLLVLSGQPINEPVAAQGPFVMNTAVEIKQAMMDYQSGRMGQLEPVA